MNEVFVCGIKIVGFQFAVTTIEEAQSWEAKDPEWNYYFKLEVRDLK